MNKKKKFRENIIVRAQDCGKHITETGDTLRTTAKLFGCSKSTVHKDINDRLLFINKRLYNKARKVLEKNLAERNLRGGLATKNKYANASQDNILDKSKS
jgi:putative DeoR family transcriptional regulator (stage III sporulation protein D)